VRMQDYPVPIDVNPLAADIDVRPGETTITYSHANFTIRQIMLAPKSLSAGTGAMVIYEMQAIRPMTVTFSLRACDAADVAGGLALGSVTGVGKEQRWIGVLHPASGASGESAGLALPGSEPGILPLTRSARLRGRCSLWCISIPGRMTRRAIRC